VESGSANCPAHRGEPTPNEDATPRCTRRVGARIGREAEQGTPPDVRIVEALYESAETGKAITIPPFQPTKRPTGRQRINRPGIRKPDVVKARPPSN
jgi:hypothetical protein